MAATVTASIASLILTLDDPGRDDLDSVTVWGSTTSGFTPSNANVVYKGKSLSITIANLTPLTTYYLKYAYISAIDPTDYVISSQLSGVPNKIDGGVIVDSLRGKTIASGVVIDGGSIVTAAVVKPTNIATTTTIYLDDTSDFPAAGAAIVISRIAAFNVSRQFRYTGKTATSLTGVSGLQNAVSAGDIVIPQPLPSFTLDSFTVGNPLNTSASAEFLFRSGGGAAIAISANRVANVFTYTAGHTLTGGVYTSVLSGVSGLAAFSLASGSRATVIDAISLVTATVAATGTVTSLTISAATGYLRSGGGKLLLASTTVTGVKKINYTAYSGTTITIDGGVYLTAASYYVIPLFAYNVIGSDLYSLINYNNSYNGEWQRTHISSDIDVSTDVSEGYEISPSVGYGLKIWPSGRASELDTAGLFIGAPAGALHVELRPIPFNSIDTAWMYSGFYGSMFIGAASAVGSYADNVLTSYDGSNLRQYQPISTTLRFSGYDAADLDAITFNDTSNTYTFSADGGSANATLIASGAAFGASDLQALNGTGGTPRGQAHATNNVFASNAYSSVNWGANIRGGGFYFGTSRGGSVASYTISAADDYMGEIRFAGSDGTQLQQGATIAVLVDGTPAAGSMPGRISFQTSPSGSANPVERAKIDQAGNVLVTGPGGLGYGTGSGGAVTQATSRTTGVTLNKTNGFIILVSAAGTTTWQSFFVTNSTVAGTDTVVVHQRSGTDLYEVHVTAVSAGSFRVSFRTTGGTTTEQPAFVFSVIKSVTA